MTSLIENKQNIQNTESIVIIGPLGSEKILKYIDLQQKEMIHYICPKEDQIMELKSKVLNLGINNIRLYDCEADELPFDAINVKQVIHIETLKPSLINELEKINKNQGKAIEFITEK